MSDPVSDLTWAALSSKETVLASYQIARAAIAAGVPGDFVECGVFAGANAAAMARAIQSFVPTAIPSELPNRRVHLFDSFTGVPERGPHDDKWEHPAGVSACSRAQVEEYMQLWKIPSELLVYHEGLFADTIPRAAAHAPQIAVLRLDGDLYESTRVVLEQLYPLVSVGGWVIIDDWNLVGCRKAVEEYFQSDVQAPIYFQRHAK